MYQTHLSKEFENQQQANNKTKKKHSETNKMTTDESNNKHTAKPIKQREECFEYSIYPNGKKNIH